jgi:hypothetical protein
LMSAIVIDECNCSKRTLYRISFSERYSAVSTVIQLRASFWLDEKTRRFAHKFRKVDINRITQWQVHVHVGRSREFVFESTGTDADRLRWEPRDLSVAGGR